MPKANCTQPAPTSTPTTPTNIKNQPASTPPAEDTPALGLTDVITTSVYIALQDNNWPLLQELQDVYNEQIQDAIATIFEHLGPDPQTLQTWTRTLPDWQTRKTLRRPVYPPPHSGISTRFHAFDIKEITGDFHGKDSEDLLATWITLLHVGQSEGYQEMDYIKVLQSIFKGQPLLQLTDLVNQQKSLDQILLSLETTFIKSIPASVTRNTIINLTREPTDSLTAFAAKSNLKMDLARHAFPEMSNEDWKDLKTDHLAYLVMRSIQPNIHNMPQGSITINDTTGHQNQTFCHSQQTLPQATIAGHKDATPEPTTTASPLETKRSQDTHSFDSDNNSINENDEAINIHHTAEEAESTKHKWGHTTNIQVTTLATTPTAHDKRHSDNNGNDDGYHSAIQEPMVDMEEKNMQQPIKALKSQGGRSTQIFRDRELLNDYHPSRHQTSLATFSKHNPIVKKKRKRWKLANTLTRPIQHQAKDQLGESVQRPRKRKHIQDQLTLEMLDHLDPTNSTGATQKRCPNAIEHASHPAGAKTSPLPGRLDQLPYPPLTQQNQKDLMNQREENCIHSTRMSNSLMPERIERSWRSDNAHTDLILLEDTHPYSDPESGHLQRGAQTWAPDLSANTHTIQSHTALIHHQEWLTEKPGYRKSENIEDFSEGELLSDTVVHTWNGGDQPAPISTLRGNLAPTFWKRSDEPMSDEETAAESFRKSRGGTQISDKDYNTHGNFSKAERAACSVHHKADRTSDHCAQFSEVNPASQLRKRAQSRSHESENSDSVDMESIRLTRKHNHRESEILPHTKDYPVTNSEANCNPQFRRGAWRCTYISPHLPSLQEQELTSRCNLLQQQDYGKVL